MRIKILNKGQGFGGGGGGGGDIFVFFIAFLLFFFIFFEKKKKRNQIRFPISNIPSYAIIIIVRGTFSFAVVLPPVHLLCESLRNILVINYLKVDFPHNNTIITIF
jgi:hypothetical protein